VSRTSSWLLAFTLVLAPVACSREERVDSGQRPAAVAEVVPVPEASGPRDVAALEITGFGEIRFELLPDLAPKTVESFLKLAEQDFYTGTTFHRVIPGFMIQGGDPNTKDRDPRNDGQGGPGYSLPDEFSPISHVRGVVAMGNTGSPGSAGSQFFIVVRDAFSLDGRYTIFGVVTDGMEVADRIALTPRDQYGRNGPRDRPNEDVVIAKVKIERGAGGTGRQARAPEPLPEAPAEGQLEWDEGSP
jgi:peptidyl-prolyl cis-trans isomerase B (cyclophilin B)